MANYDSTELLASIRRRARAPASTAPGWENADLLAMVNEELLSVLGPQLFALRGDFFKVVADTALTAGTASYYINTRTIAGTVAEIVLVLAGGAVLDLDHWSEEDFDGLDPTKTGTPEAYVIRGNQVVLYPVPDNSSVSLRQVYYRRPNRIVATSAVMAVTSLASAPTYAGTKPSTILTTTPCDVIRATPHFDSLRDDATPSAVVASTSVTFTSSVTGVAVGDYVCLAGESPVVQLPVEAFAVLAQRVANQLLRGGADPGSLREGEAELEKMEKVLFGLPKPRNQGEQLRLRAPSWLP